MPLFRRPDGTLLKDLPGLRRIMPYVMPGRNESAVYVDLRLHFDRVKKWLWEYNRALPAEPATVLHLVLFSLGRLFAEYPQLDRFVAGQRIYQRLQSTVSLIVKESLDAQAPSYAVKLPVAERDESLPAYSRRVAEILQQAREHQRQTERWITRLLRLPGWLVRLTMAFRQCLDDWSLLPQFPDPGGPALQLLLSGQPRLDRAAGHLSSPLRVRHVQPVRRARIAAEDLRDRLGRHDCRSRDPAAPPDRRRSRGRRFRVRGGVQAAASIPGRSDTAFRPAPRGGPRENAHCRGPLPVRTPETRPCPPW